MNAKEIKRRFEKRVCRIEKARETALEGVFAEIRAEFDWPKDSFVYTERVRSTKKLGELSKWVCRYSISWVAKNGTAVIKPISRSLGECLLDLGFPSGS